MRKEVKRSLLLWPAAASATITAASWFTTNEGLTERIQLSRAASVARQAISWTTGPARAEVAARHEHGSRAMQLPERVAGAFGIDTEVVPAPVVDENRELAGIVILPPQNMIPEVEVVSTDLLSGERLASRDPLAAHAIAASTLQSMRRRDSAIESEQASRPWTMPSVTELLLAPASDVKPPPFVGPLRPESMETKPTEVPKLKPRSVLPDSIRALGRRVIDSMTRDYRKAIPPIVEATTPSPEVAEPLSIPSPSDLPTLMQNDEPEVDQPQAETEQVEAPAIVDNDDRPAGSAEATDSDRNTTQRSPAGWPITQRLDEQLQQLASMVDDPAAPMVSWSRDVADRLDQLQSLSRLGEPQAGALIDELERLAMEGQRQAEAHDVREQQTHWLRAAYAVTRRVAVWRPVWQVTQSGDGSWMVTDLPTEKPRPMEDSIDAVRADLINTGDVSGWSKFLLLDEIAEAASVDDIDERKVLAQRFLSRLDWHGLDEEQRRWLDRDSVTQLSKAARPWAQSAVDYANLMSQLERQEADTIDLSAIDIAGAVQTLRFAENPLAVSVSNAINTHYRNANVRLALSQPMLQRMMPTMDDQSLPVRTKLLGSRIRGTTKIESDLKVELEPSRDRWSLKLNTLGNVKTRSTGIEGAVAVRTAGDSRFVAATPIEVTAHGVYVGDSSVDVKGRSRLNGIRTDYDGWPLIGSLVRSIATSRYQEMSPRADRIANRRIGGQVQERIDDEVDTRVGKATSQLSEMVLGPLGRLQLDPKVVDMQTTSERLLARYRLAGDWQLGAFTARPRAPRSSLMSVQVHQSALNNTLEQLMPRDEPMTIRDMILSSAETFGQTNLQLSDDIPDDVTVQFAPTRPMTVEIEDGRLWVTLRIIRLNRGNRVSLTRFIVRAAYKPELAGMEALLVRDGHLRISGPGMSMRERLPVRAIFNKVLSPNRPLRLTLPQFIDHPVAEGLAVSQLELRSGWIGMAISESAAPKVALVQPSRR